MKLVRCIHGSIFDVLVDIRKDSPTFLQWFGTELTSENRKMLVIPEGFAHGFQALEDNCEILYLTTEYYFPECESGMRYNDPLINVQWPLNCEDISEKDLNHPLLQSDFYGIEL